MKALLLSFGFGLVAVLQAQEFPDTEEIQDVRLTWAGASRGFMADRGVEVGGWAPIPSSSKETSF